MGIFGSGPEEVVRVPITFKDQLKNAIQNNWRGLLGIIPLIIIAILLSPLSKTNCTQCLWAYYTFCLFIQPVHAPVSGLIIAFGLPLLGVLSTKDVCKFFLTHLLVLFICGGWLSMSMNCSGMDKRVMLKIIGGANTPKKLLFKASLAAFVMSMFTNKLIVTEFVMGIISSSLESESLHVRCILCNMIATAASLGGVSFIHLTASVVNVVAIVKQYQPNFPMPDVLNYLEYSMRALPFAIVALLVCIGLNTFRLRNAEISPVGQAALAANLADAQSEVPDKPSCHEWATVFFTAASTIVYLMRWSKSFFGWKYSGFGIVRGEIDPAKDYSPFLGDASIAAAFVIIMNVLPKTMRWAQWFKGGITKNNMPSVKPESGIIFWKFVDKRTNYGNIFMIGSSLALHTAVRTSGVAKMLLQIDFLKTVVKQKAILIIFITFMSNIMTSIGVTATFSPLFLQLDEDLSSAFFIAVASTFGYAGYFLWTPSYYVRTIGKIPLKNQIKCAVGNVLVCCILLIVLSFIDKMFCLELCVVRKMSSAFAEEWDKNITKGIVPGPPSKAAGAGAGATTAATTSIKPELL